MMNKPYPVFLSAKNKCSSVTERLVEMLDFMCRILIVLCSMFAVTAAAEWSASVDRTSINLSDSLTLTLRATDKHQQLSDQPDLSLLQTDFDILDTQQSSQYQNINGQTRAWSDWIVTLSAKQIGDLIIPAIPLGSYKTIPIHIEVSNKQNPGTADQVSPVFIQSSVSDITPYVQQEVVLTLQIIRSTNLVGEQTLHPLKIENAIVNQLGDVKQYSRIINNKRYSVIEVRYVIYPQKPGHIRIPSVVFESFIPTQPSPNRFFSTARAKPIKATSEPVNIDVKGIPSNYPADKPWLPARSLTLTESWQGGDPKKLKLSDSITRIITVNADGLSGSQIPRPAIGQPDSIKIYPDQATSTEKPENSGLHSILQQAFALMPTKAGDIKLPEVSYTWFNTLSHTVELAEIPERIVHVVDSVESSAESSLKTDELDNTSLEPDFTDDIVPVASLRFWQAITFGLLIALSCVLIFVFHLNRKTKKISTAVEDDTLFIENNTLDEKTVYNDLIKICQTGDTAEIRAALLRWLHLALILPSHYSLQQADQHAGIPTLSNLINQVNLDLFSGSALESDNINPEKIIEILNYSRNAIRKKASNKTSDLLTILNPL